MKSESGVTVTSLIIYIIAMLIMIGIVATITSFFYTNVSNLDDNSQNVSEITKFNMYFIEEVEKKGNRITSYTNNTISFASGNTYTFQDRAIYLNTIRICENITNVQFKVETAKEKTIITVLMSIGNKMEYTKTTQYVMVPTIGNFNQFSNNI